MIQNICENKNNIFRKIKWRCSPPPGGGQGGRQLRVFAAPQTRRGGGGAAQPPGAPGCQRWGTRISKR